MSIIFRNLKQWWLNVADNKANYHGAQGSECFLVLSNNMAGSGGDYASIHASGHTELMQN